jgi:outer membrane protein
MKKGIGVVAVVWMLFMMTGQLVQAAADYKSVGVRMRAIYVIPDEKFDTKLGGLNPQVEDNIIPELDFEYFFTKNISAELITGVTQHEIKLKGDYAGSTWLLPPTLTAKYHPFAGSLVSPYVGAGVNAIFPFDSHLNGINDFKIENSFGWAAQAGADIRMAENLYLNLDYKYLNAHTKATVGGTKYKLNLDPTLVGIGVGYRF